MNDKVTPKENGRQYRSEQLQLIAEIGQATSAYRDVDKLLYDMVYLIRDQLGFYYVSIFFPVADRTHLTLIEATGEIGQELKQTKFHIPFAVDSIIGWVAVNQQARIAHNVGDDPLYLQIAALSETRSEIALPLLAQGELLGVLDVQSRDVEKFDGEDLAILQILANHVAVNIDNAQLFALREARLNETEALLNLNNLLTTTLDVGEIYRRAARVFTQQLRVARCAVSSWELEANTVTTQAEFVYDLENDIVDQYEMSMPSYDLSLHVGTAELLKSLIPVLRQADDPQLEQSERQILLDMDQHYCLELPLVRGDAAVGIVELYRTKNQRPFSNEDVQLAQAMANQTAIAIDNATLASEARARVAQLSMLNRLSIALSLAPNLADIFDGARREIFSLVEVTGMSIMILSPDKQTLDWIYGYEYGSEVDLSSIPPLSVSQGFSGYVVRTRRPLLVNAAEVARMTQVLQPIQIGAAPNSWYGLPLIVANELIGVLAVENELDDNAFSERDIELLQILSGPVAIAINNLLQLEAVQNALAAQSEQRVQLQTAAEVAAATTSILDLNELMQRSVDLIQERFNLYYTGLFLISPDTNFAVLRAGTGKAGQIQIARQHQLKVGGRSLIGGATNDGLRRITQNVSLNEEWLPNPVLPDTRSELALPLRVRGRIIGALTVQNVTANAFSEELIGTLQTMADQLAVAIENAQLLKLAEVRTQRQLALNQISAQLYRTADVNEIVRIGLGALSHNFNGRNVELILGNTSQTHTED
jgi:GAF domain-containing protein